jgi:cobalt-zinc-cadmium resistance protein CzcA
MNFALTVRLAREYRRNVDAIRSIPVAVPSNDPKTPTAYIALGDLGEVKLETGAAYIYRENNQRFVPLKYSVRGRDLGSTVAEAQDRIAKNLPMPQGYRMEWTGEFGALVDAQKRLAIIVPLVDVEQLALVNDAVRNRSGLALLCVEHMEAAE